VHGDEQIGLRMVREIGALIERKIIVALAREHHIRAQTVMQQLSQAPRYVEHQIFFQQSLAAHRSEVPAAVAGVERNPKFGRRERRPRLPWVQRFRRHRRPFFLISAPCPRTLWARFQRSRVERIQVHGDLIRLLAGYGQGQFGLRKWVDAVHDDGDPLMFIEAIPNGHTRAFIEDALVYSWHYAAELHLPATSLDALAAGRYPRLVRAGEDARTIGGGACAR